MKNATHTLWALLMSFGLALTIVACSGEDEPVPAATVEALTGAYEKGKKAILESSDYHALHKAKVDPLIEWEEESSRTKDGEPHVQLKDGSIWITDDANTATMALDVTAINGSGEEYRPTVFAYLKFRNGEWEVDNVIAD